MIKKTENCIYCGEKMESITAKKRYCSSKCKVYDYRERSRIVTETAKNDKKTKIAGNLPILEKECLKSPKIEKLPPSNLKGLDLLIWKEENK
jgi:predicted nucleic acid-binding Zn ribbon protein